MEAYSDGETEVRETITAAAVEEEEGEGEEEEEGEAEEEREVKMAGRRLSSLTVGRSHQN